MNKEVLDLLKEAQGVLTGHFCLTSGLHSDIYFQCAKLYQYPQITEKIGKLISKELSGEEFETVISPAIGALIIGYETAKQSQKRNLFVERKDGKMELRRGYTLRKGEKVVIIEDVITTARTIHETIDAIKEFGVEVVAVGCIVDRTCGKTGLNIKSLLKIDPVTYDPTDCPLCKEELPLVKPGSREKVHAC